MKNKEKMKVLLTAVLLSGSMTFGGLTVHAAEDNSTTNAEESSTTDIVDNVNEISDDPKEIIGATQEIVTINETNFPDPNFREIIREWCDANKDGSLSELEVNNVYELDCSREYDDDDNIRIKNMKGIEYLTRLQEINVSNNRIGEIDLSHNTNLTVLNISENELLELNISSLSNLEVLDCSFNPLNHLDVSSNLNLKELKCNRVSPDSLDISKNTELIKLEACNNYLDTLDVSNNTKLKNLLCPDNHLKELNISNNPELLVLNCANNELSNLDLTHNKALKTIGCYGNKLTSLNTNQNNELEELSIIKSLDVSKNTKLIYLLLCDNQLESLDLANNQNLSVLDVTRNPMKKIDVSACPNLVKVANDASPRAIDLDTYISIDFMHDDFNYSLSLDPDDILITGADSFQDVEVGGWYREAVLYAKDNAFMNGTSAVTFDPFMTLTRAQFVTVLYNMEGGSNLPKPDYTGKFVDVPENEWFTNPVMWAFKNGITSGVSENQFGTKNNITREQLATLLYQYAVFKGIDISTNNSEFNNFTDTDQISDWAYEAMLWAVSNHVMNGKPAAESTYILDPAGTATRAECAQMIMNFILNTSNTGNN